MKWIALYLLGILSSFIIDNIVKTSTRQGLLTCVEKIETAQKCLREYIPKSVKYIGAKETLRTLEEAESNQGIACHLAGHLVGENALGRYVEMRQALSICGNSCQYGCTHGVMAKIFRMSQEANLTEIGRMCEDNGHEVEILDTTACFHGIGHGVAEYSNYSMPNSLNLCAQLETDIRRRECASGVFMEMFDTNISGRVLEEISTKLCDDAPSTLREMCETTIMNYEFIRTQDPTASIMACSSMAEDLKNTCFSALGSETVFVYGRDLESIWSVCSNTTSGLMPSECMKGVMYSAMVVDKQGEYAINLCSFDNNTMTNQSCFDLVLQNLIQIKSPYLQDICGRLKNEYEYDCKI